MEKVPRGAIEFILVTNGGQAFENSSFLAQESRESGPYMIA